MNNNQQQNLGHYPQGYMDQNHNTLQKDQDKQFSVPQDQLPYPQGQQQFQNSYQASDQQQPEGQAQNGINSDILAQLQQIQQLVASSSDLGPNTNFNQNNQNPEKGSGIDQQKQDNATATAFGMDTMGKEGDFYKGQDGGLGGGMPQSEGLQQQQQQEVGQQQMKQMTQLVDQKSVAQNQGNDAMGMLQNQMLQQNFSQSMLGGMGALPGQNLDFQNQGQLFAGGQGGLDMMTLQSQMLMAQLNNQIPGMAGMSQLPMQQYPMMMPQGMGPGGGMSSAASFHQPAEKNQIKLFVGGLAYPTTEADLMAYFRTYGKVENTIVMRDKVTKRGRGFGFVLLSFPDEDEALDAKGKILSKNREDGHMILDKRVDVKSADDYQGKAPGMGQNSGPGSQFMVTNSGQTIQKPNPYVMVEQKDSHLGSHDKDDDGKNVVFSYPKSKIFVGGLDFKLTSEELKDHFMKFGDVQDAIILKDIFTGQSRGFGFVTFTQEHVAQELIRNNPVTEINGRRVDIKKAEPKEKGSGPPLVPGGKPGMLPRGDGMQMNQNQPAMIPPYGQEPRQDNHGRGQRSGHGYGRRNPSEEYHDQMDRQRGYRQHDEREHHQRHGGYRDRGSQGSMRRDYGRRHRQGSTSSHESGQDSGSYSQQYQRRRDGGRGYGRQDFSRHGQDRGYYQQHSNGQNRRNQRYRSRSRD